MNAEKTHKTGAWFLGSGIAALTLLAFATGYVSFAAQYLTIFEAKASPGYAGTHWPSAVGALSVDFGAITFAFMGIGAALRGYRTTALRLGNIGCIAASLTMNVANADIRDGLDVLAWSVSPVIYAFASDRLIAVLRDVVLGRTVRPWSGKALWLLRFTLSPVTTFKGMRDAVLLSPAVPANLSPVPASLEREDVPVPPRPSVPELETSPVPELVPASPSLEDVPAPEASPRPRRPRNRGASPGDTETIATIRERFGDSPTVRQIKSLGMGSSRAEALHRKIQTKGTTS